MASELPTFSEEEKLELACMDTAELNALQTRALGMMREELAQELSQAPQ